MHVDHFALQQFLPHRGCNLLPDTLDLADDWQTSASRTRIPADDGRGRTVFARDDGAHWYEPFLVELMALTGVPMLHPQLSPNGLVGVFSMISRISFTRLVPMGTEVMGFAKQLRGRGGFTSFATWAEVDGQRILEAEVLSGSAALKDIGAIAARPFTIAPIGIPVDAGRLAWKPAHLRFADLLLSADAATRSAKFAYTYTSTHPFIPGHFPDAPLMMGMSQWSGIADAAWLAAGKFGITGPITANGTIKRPDGTEVMDVRELVLVDEGGTPRIASTKRIAFREPVRPTDGLIIEVTVAGAGAGA